VKLVIEQVCCVDEATLKRNIQATEGPPEPKGSGPLAVIGGGPSVLDHLDEIKAWSGEIWAINGAHLWCKAQGVRSFLYSVDPHELLLQYTDKADRCVLASHCDPRAFKAPECYRMTCDLPGPTSATSTTISAIEAGYSSVVYYGCESSYQSDKSHAYMDEDLPDLLRIACNGEEFLTKPEFILQAQFLGAAIAAAPGVFTEKSGGLLRAMLRGVDFDALAGSKNIHETMRILA
jgi:hypothetical protein